ncbi:hypothetical protein L208DRAFT_1451912 [Tricholoma matsutake]|nr:hypothetical protein L208DRAFT_1451912 [Tricholoma matsutake 945]
MIVAPGVEQNMTKHSYALTYHRFYRTFLSFSFFPLPSSPTLPLVQPIFETTMPEFSATVINLFQTKRAATDQGGLLSGKDPSAYNPSDPIRLWIIQVGIIVSMASLLSLGLRKIRQPKVIAEVLGGILLGPTAFGRIPGFTQHIFPTQSQPFLSLVANIGLCLFLFLVGLEIDGAVIKRNVRLSATVALSGMILPFGLGAGLAVPIYKQFIDSSIKFTHFMLFSGVAFSITAFPVLCRILTELKLLDTTVGIVVLSAGVGNDIIGWTLLALSVALVNAASGLTALWVLLACIGWTLFLLFPVKWALRWLARSTGSIQSGPTVVFMTVTMLLLFGSAFFTDVIGVHAIFGAFVAGIIVPREGGLAIALTEKLEDMVAILFLPLYFTLSGLSTNLGLLNDGITWGYTIAIISCAFAGKFGGCTLAARYIAGFNWRESGAIGSLMSCKGLVELIVLNVGLSAGILTQRVFSMFVLEALVLTFMTTPLVTALYPPHVRKRISTTGTPFGNVPGDEGSPGLDKKMSLSGEVVGAARRHFTVVLDNIEHLPGALALAQLIQPAGTTTTTSDTDKLIQSSSLSPSIRRTNHSQVTLSALRLIELSDRTSAVMKSSVADTLLHTDPLLAVLRMYGVLHLYGVPIQPALAIVSYEGMADSVMEHAREYGSEMVMLPWVLAGTDSTGGGGEVGTPSAKSPTSNNPFEALFRSAAVFEKSASVMHSQFVRSVFAQAKTTDVALFVDPASGVHMQNTGSQHVFLPFFGGPDDRLALEFVVQICENPRFSASVVRVMKREVEVNVAGVPLARVDSKDRDGKLHEEANMLTVASGAPGFPDTVYGQPNTQTRMQSETADNITWARYAGLRKDSSSVSSAALGRIEFRELATPVPLHAAIQEANLVAESPGGRLLILAGRSRRLAVESHRVELKELLEEYGSSGMGAMRVGSEVRKTLGDVASAFVVAGVGSGVVLVQAASVGRE